MPRDGEKTLFSIASEFRRSHRVVLLTNEPCSHLRIRGLARQLDLNLDHIELARLDQWDFNNSIDFFIATGNNTLPSLAGIAKYNLYLCNSIPLEPEPELHQRLAFWDTYQQILVCSPLAYKKLIDQQHTYNLPPKPISIINPPIHLAMPSPITKRKLIIINEDPFHSGGHQHHLIESFNRLVNENGIQAELHFAGSIFSNHLDREYFLSLQAKSTALPIYFHINISKEKLNELRRSASIYWHISHEFVAQGIYYSNVSMLECMSSGCIPIVFSKNTLASIVEEGRTGFNLIDMESFIATTLRVLKENDADWVMHMREQIMADSEKYGKSAFLASIQSLGIPLAL